MTEPSVFRPRRPAASRGRPRVSDPKTVPICFRCTAQDHAVIKAAAARTGYMVGPYLRALALGSPGPRAARRPPVEREALARILGHLGKVGSNINQLAHGFNRDHRIPGLTELVAIRHEVAAMRGALMKALGRGD
jgi:hypothetical protein